MSFLPDRVIHIIDGFVQRQAFPSSLIITGPKGMDLETVTRHIVEVSNKDNADALLKLNAGTFVDYVILDREGASTKINDVRNLQERCKYGPANSSHLFAVIPDADTLTDQAANALLKTLEEAPPSTTFLLLCPNAMDLLPTIRSRSQFLNISHSGKAPDLPEEGLPIAKFMALSPVDRLSHMTQLAGSKPNACIQLEYWLYELSNTHAMSNLVIADPIIKTRRSLNSNANTRLQLEALATAL
ncbi:hypothetical protein HOH87_03610 [bacterium]|jgi:hypothetical protein|nr:hypothetical protein [bacterium]